MNYKIILLALTCLSPAFLSAAASAAPLDTDKVPADAKWVIYVDLETLADSKVAEQVREERPQQVAGMRGWLKNRYGIEPQEDLKSLTMYGDSYEQHRGTAVLKSSYDKDKVKQGLDRPHVQRESWGDHTLYRVPTEQPREARPPGEPRKMTVVLYDDETIVFASSDEKAKSAVMLLKGEGSPIEKDSPLLREMPENAVVYGAAKDLEEMKEREGFFPVLKQHERIYWYIEADNGRVREHLSLTAKSEDIAEEMKNSLQGLTALGKVWAEDSEHIKKWIEKKEFKRDGKVVEVTGEADEETVVKALTELRDRVQQRVRVN